MVKPDKVAAAKRRLSPRARRARVRSSARVVVTSLLSWQPFLARRRRFSSSGWSPTRRRPQRERRFLRRSTKGVVALSHSTRSGDSRRRGASHGALRARRLRGVAASALLRGTATGLRCQPAEGRACRQRGVPVLTQSSFPVGLRPDFPKYRIPSRRSQ